jgi:hypothetical protein
MLAVAERLARPKAERFDRPLRLRDGRVFLYHFPVRQLPDTGLLSLSLFLLRPSGCGGQAGTSPLRTILNP